MKKKKTFVIVKTSFDATHNWPDATNFLKYPHHHKFYVVVFIQTIPGDMNRTFEFFEIKKIVDQCIQNLLDNTDDMPSIGALSTEAFSDLLYSELCNKFREVGKPIDDIEVRIRVMEDNNAGSVTCIYGGCNESID